MWGVGVPVSHPQDEVLGLSRCRDYFLRPPTVELRLRLLTCQ